MLATFLNDGWNGWRGRNHDGQIDGIGHVAYTFVCLLALDCVSLGVDWIDSAVKSSSKQIAKDDLADRILTLAGAKDGDAVDIKNEGDVCDANDETIFDTSANECTPTTSTTKRTRPSGATHSTNPGTCDTFFTQGKCNKIQSKKNMPISHLLGSNSGVK